MDWKHWVMLGAAWLILMYLLKGVGLTLSLVLEALEEGLRPNSDLGNYARHQEWKGGERTRFTNTRVSIFYLMSFFDVDGRQVRCETIDFSMAGYRGRYKISFVDDEVFKWIQNGVNLPVARLCPVKTAEAHKILEAVRSAYRNNIST
ncbi:MAG: hypothetical protein JNN11_03325 [Candidatus Doudnabacteria bacterium]|nr:hypothetical protein [Candidatus Doudnabacteria bacterium]